MTTTTAAGKGGIYALAEPLWPRYANVRERNAARLPSFAALQVVLRWHRVCYPVIVVIIIHVSPTLVGHVV